MQTKVTRLRQLMTKVTSLMYKMTKVIEAVDDKECEAVGDKSEPDLLAKNITDAAASRTES